MKTITFQRKPIQMGYSWVIAIPKIWAKTNQLQRRQEVTVTWDTDTNQLVITPPEVEA